MPYYELDPILINEDGNDIYDVKYNIIDDDNTVKYSGSVKVVTSIKQEAIDYVGKVFLSDLKDRNNAKYMKDVDLSISTYSNETNNEPLNEPLNDSDNEIIFNEPLNEGE